MTVVDSARGVTVHGVRLSYREAGSGAPLVLVHGNFGSKRWFQEQLVSPPAGWRLLALDLPNFGESDRMPEKIEVVRYAEYLAGFCDSLELERPALLGHSFGGAVVQALAARQPKAISKLLLVSSVPPDGLDTPSAHIDRLRALEGDRSAMADALAATMPSRRPDLFEELVDDGLGMASSAFTGNVEALARFNLRQTVDRVEVPVLVLRGDLDLPHLITEAMARQTASSYPRSRLELWPDVGHSPQLEAPDRFNRLLTEFLKEPS